MAYMFILVLMIVNLTLTLKMFARLDHLVLYLQYYRKARNLAMSRTRPDDMNDDNVSVSCWLLFWWESMLVLLQGQKPISLKKNNPTYQGYSVDLTHCDLSKFT